jgi:tetratricopeptide (TPR) repeat protein
LWYFLSKLGINPRFMSKFALANAALLTAILSLPLSPTTEPTALYDATAVKTKTLISCTPVRLSIAKLIAESDEIMLLPGSGTYVWKISSKSDSAQLYFNQGINMYYGFHIIESIASFKKAANFDASNPMIWWAQALAYGPNINDIGYTASPEALSSTSKAEELSSNASDVEKALISAMKVRYSSDTTKTREGLNQDYVDAMKEAANRFPENMDVQTLYADAMMLQHPWDLWQADGIPKPWQPAIQMVLEKVIKAAPMHPGANHYYIHVMEASPHPEMALHSADILGKITPGLSHLVHMPSHIYLRTGNFDSGVSINKAAVKQFREYSNLFPASNANAFIYYWHNLHMLSNCALLSGRYNEALKSAEELKSVLDTPSLSMPPPLGSYLYYMYMTPDLVNVRFEKWDKVLAANPPDVKYTYANVLHHFVRGMALAGKKNFAEAKNEAGQVEALMKDESLKIPMSPFSPVSEGSMVAFETLNGFIALNEKDYKTAIDHFEKSSGREWAMVYTEPRDWMLNPYQYLGTAYLADKNYKNAEQAFRKDLSRNAKNVWSLNGLEKSLRLQGRKKEALAVKDELKKASAKADVVIH